MCTSKGLATEAVSAFFTICMPRKLLATYKPDYIAAIFESAAPTFRSEAYTDYKANRTEMPPDLGEQIPYVRQTLEAMRIPILEFDKFEADDVIGTIATTAPKKHAGLETVIVSSDKDMLQLVNDRVSMLNPMKDDTWYDPEKVAEFMGVRPDQVADLLALKGDSVDNIPGAPGIGDKGAKDLITQFGTLTAALERAGEVERKTYRESLQNHRDQILLSKKLATIDTGVPVVWQLEQLKAQKPDSAALKLLYREMEFFSLLKELGPEDTSHTRDFAVIDTEEALDSWLASRPADAPLAFTVDATNGFLGLAFQAGCGRAVPARLIERLRPALEDPELKKVVHDAKATEREANELGIKVAGIRDDVMLYAFLLNAEPSGCSPEALSERYLDRKLNAAAEQRAEAMIAALGVLKPQVHENGLERVYEEIDLLLAPVLARMETTGIRVDTQTLAAQGVVLSAQIEELAAKVYEVAGKPFNINSPSNWAGFYSKNWGCPCPSRREKGRPFPLRPMCSRRLRRPIQWHNWCWIIAS